MADHNSSGCKLPPVNGTGQFVDGDSSKNASKELSQGNDEVGVKTRRDSSRYNQVFRRKSRPHQSSCYSETSIASSDVGSYEKRRGLMGRNNCNVDFSTTVSRRSVRHNSLDKLQVSRSQVRPRRPSDSDIFAADSGNSEGGSANCAVRESFLSSKFEEQSFDKEKYTSRSQHDVNVPKCLLLSDDPRPPAADMTLHTLRDMQLRYKNLMQLSKQVQFSNTQVLKGERIRKPYTVPGPKSQNNLSSCGAAVNKDLELLAVLSVKHKSGSESCAHSITHNSVALGLAKKLNNKVSSESDLLLHSVARREKIYENRKKLKKKEVTIARRKRGAALKEDSERLLIAKAIEMGNAKIKTSKCCSESETNIALESKPQEHLDKLNPKASVTLSGVSPVRRSIEITLPDCTFVPNTEDEDDTSYTDKDFVFTPLLDGIHANDEITDDVLGTDDVDVQHPSQEKTTSPEALSAEIAIRPTDDQPCEESSRVESASIFVGDFLSVPVSTVTRSFDVLSIGRTGRSSGMDIPEIRMICATPLPPGSPE